MRRCNMIQTFDAYGPSSAETFSAMYLASGCVSTQILPRGYRIAYDIFVGLKKAIDTASSLL